MSLISHYGTRMTLIRRIFADNKRIKSALIRIIRVICVPTMTPQR